MPLPTGRVRAGRRRTLLALLGGVAMAAVFGALALRGVDATSLFGVWKDMSVWPWVPLAIASYLLGHVVRGQRCRILFGPQAQLQLGAASSVVVVGYACNNVLPLRLGEFVRASMLTERTGAPFVQSLSILFLERILDGIAILVLLLGAGLWMPVGGWIGALARTATWVFAAAVLVMMPLIFAPSYAVNLATRLGSVHRGLQGPAVRLATRVIAAFGAFRRPGVVLKTALLSLLIWSLEAGLFVLMLPAFHLHLSSAVGVLAMAVTNLGIMVPSTPGYVGPFHYFCQQVLVSQGVTDTTGLAYATAVHLAFYLPVTLWGAIGLLWFGVEVGTALSMARRARQASVAGEKEGVAFVRLEALAPAPARVVASSRLLSAFVEALVSVRAKAPDLEVVDRAAEFLAAQMAALPVLLRTAVTFGLTVFRGAVFATHLRTFCALPSERRRKIIETCAFGRIGLLRAFFRPLRSIACLAYYELLQERLLRSPAGFAERSLSTPVHPRIGAHD